MMMMMCSDLICTYKLTRILLSLAHMNFLLNTYVVHCSACEYTQICSCCILLNINVAEKLLNIVQFGRMPQH